MNERALLDVTRCYTFNETHMPRTGSLYELANDLEREQKRNLTPNEVAATREALREQHTAMIEGIEAGAMGDSGMDPTDRATYWKSDNPEFAEWAEEWIGGAGSKKGLSNSEKAILYEQSEAEIDRLTTPQAIRDFKKQDAAFNQALADLYPRFALAYPDCAADHEAARAGMARLLSNTTLTKGQLAKLVETDAETLMTMIATEIETPGSVTRRRKSYLDDDDNRTAGFSTGSSGAPRGGQQREVEPEALSHGMSAWQRKNGWTR